MNDVIIFIILNALLIIATTIDIVEKQIPYWLQLSFFGLTLFSYGIREYHIITFISMTLSIILLSLLYILWKEDIIGGADIKIICCISLILGIFAIPFILLMSPMILIKNKFKKRIAFLPFISLAYALTLIIFREHIVPLYGII